jgi:hypothetical protein
MRGDNQMNTSKSDPKCFKKSKDDWRIGGTFGTFLVPIIPPMKNGKKNKFYLSFGQKMRKVDVFCPPNCHF